MDDGAPAIKDKSCKESLNALANMPTRCESVVAFAMSRARRLRVY
jgi:hypothetical protein